MICKQKIMLAGCFLIFPHQVWAEAPGAEILHRNLAYGEIIELNLYTPEKEKNLMLRLFATPALDEECGIENDGICKNQHLITSATFDENPEVQVHVMKAKGEFVEAKWINSESEKSISDSAELIMTFREHHQFALKSNSNLKEKRFKVRVELTPREMKETVEGK